MLHHLLFSVPAEPTAVSGFILSGIKGVFVLIGGIIAMILCAIIAKSKGYSAILFGILGLFFSILTLIVVIVLPRRQRA